MKNTINKKSNKKYTNSKVWSFLHKVISFDGQRSPNKLYPLANVQQTPNHPPTLEKFTKNTLNQKSEFFAQSHFSLLSKIAKKFHHLTCTTFSLAIFGPRIKWPCAKKFQTFLSYCIFGEFFEFLVDDFACVLHALGEWNFFGDLRAPNEIILWTKISDFWVTVFLVNVRFLGVRFRVCSTCVRRWNFFGDLRASNEITLWMKISDFWVTVFLVNFLGAEGWFRGVS